MKLNLGCGDDLREGYLNVDINISPMGGYQFDTLRFDLSKFPWPWKDQSVEEILMLDFLEHFSYRETRAILDEAWRVLLPQGMIEIQVPDFQICAAAAGIFDGYDVQCNRCGETFSDIHDDRCSKCKQDRIDVKRAAIKRLFGGQDRIGNWHHNAFTSEIIVDDLKISGFGDVKFLEFNENGETYSQNWNLKLQAKKKDGWE